MKVSEKYRAKALGCEQRGRDATDYDIRCAWGEVAIEWHCLSNRAAQGSALDYELEFTSRSRAPQVTAGACNNFTHARQTIL
jgi:hypothetical protein